MPIFVTNNFLMIYKMPKLHSMALGSYHGNLVCGVLPILSCLCYNVIYVISSPKYRTNKGTFSFHNFKKL